MSRNVLIVSTAFVLTGSLALFAQQTQQSRQNQNNNQTTNQNTTTTTGQAGRGQEGQSRGADQLLATCIALGNQEEIALAELGKQKAQSEEVKKFADMMIKDHQQYLTKLQRHAPSASQPGSLKSGTGTRGSRAGAQSGTENSTTTAANATSTNNDSNQTTTSTNRDQNQRGNQGDTATSRRSTTATGADVGSTGFMAQQEQIEREVAQQCLTSAEQKLSQKTGAEFDKCFMNLQVSKHMSMKDKLQVYQRHASSDLAQVFAAGLKTTEEHLAHAEQLAESLEHGGSTTTRTKSSRNDREADGKSGDSKTTGSRNAQSNDKEEK